MSSSYDPPAQDWPTQPHPQAPQPGQGGPAGQPGAGGGPYPGSAGGNWPYPGSAGGNWPYPGNAGGGPYPGGAGGGPYPGSAGGSWPYPGNAAGSWSYPGGPAGGGGGWPYPDQPPRRPRRRGRILLAAGAVIAVAAAGTAWAAGTGTPRLSTAEIAAQTDPGLVDVTSTLGYQQAVAEGTGMVLTSNGEVLTNNHVIAGATAIKVRDIGNGRSYRAEVVGYSEGHDVAVLQLKGASGLSTVSLGDSSKVTAGQRVVALGNAGGKGGTPSVAVGKVTGLGSAITAEDSGSGVAEHLTGMIRMNAGIEPGDSGGPLLNTAGQVIGMDTAASTSPSTGPGMTSTATTAAATTAFAIPVNKAIAVASQIEAGQGSAAVHIGRTGFLGVAVTAAGAQTGLPGSQSASGAAVAGVVPGTPAARTGISAGDTLVSLGGHAISSSSDLRSVLQGYHPGDRVTITWADQTGQTQTATIVLTAGPAG